MTDVASGMSSPSSTTHASVQLLFELLDEARTPAERATAISVGAQSVEPLLGRYFMHHAHLAVRGGTRALLRESRDR